MIDLSEARRISMLDTPVLERLQTLARDSKGGILEIGSYIGGSTVALASGHQGSRRHAVIDCGGSYPDQPHLPSDDILRDWRANVSAFGVSEHVCLFEGWSTDSRVSSAALRHLNHDIGLFFFDGDGMCAEQFSVYARYMKLGCVIVLDDYFTAEGSKADLVRPWVDAMTERGVFGPGELIDGTWFTTLRRKIDFTHFKHAGGNAWLMPTRENAKGRLLEDGVPLPAPDAIHDIIREVGFGHYSRWDFPSGPQVIFSTSDNSDPNTNGRLYEFRPHHYASSNSIEKDRMSPVSAVTGAAAVTNALPV